MTNPLYILKNSIIYVLNSPLVVTKNIFSKFKSSQNKQEPDTTNYTFNSISLWQRFKNIWKPNSYYEELVLITKWETEIDSLADNYYLNPTMMKREFTLLYHDTTTAKFYSRTFQEFMCNFYLQKYEALVKVEKDMQERSFVYFTQQKFDLAKRCTIYQKFYLENRIPESKTQLQSMDDQNKLRTESIDELLSTKLKDKEETYRKAITKINEQHESKLAQIDSLHHQELNNAKKQVNDILEMSKKQSEDSLQEINQQRDSSLKAIAKQHEDALLELNKQKVLYESNLQEYQTQLISKKQEIIILQNMNEELKSELRNDQSKYIIESRLKEKDLQYQQLSDDHQILLQVHSELSDTNSTLRTEIRQKDATLLHFNNMRKQEIEAERKTKQETFDIFVHETNSLKQQNKNLREQLQNIQREQKTSIEEIEKQQNCIGLLRTDLRKFENVAISVAITAYSRIYMYNFLIINNIIDNLLYMDTDSIIITTPLNATNISTELGKFKLVANINKLLCLGTKFYLYKTGENYVYVFKGFQQEKYNMLGTEIYNHLLNQIKIPPTDITKITIHFDVENKKGIFEPKHFIFHQKRRFIYTGKFITTRPWNIIPAS